MNVLNRIALSPTEDVEIAHFRVQQGWALSVTETLLKPVSPSIRKRDTLNKKLGRKKRSSNQVKVLKHIQPSLTRSKF